jgi:hypothetical protein
MSAAIQQSLGAGVGPFPASDADGGVPGDLHLALAGPGETSSRTTPFAGHPDLLKHRSVKLALDLLRLRIRNTDLR